MWSLINVQETLSHFENENVYNFTETFDPTNWNVITDIPTNVTYWSRLSITDSGTITKNDTPTPF